MSKFGVSVVVPVYNSEASLRLLVERLEPVLAAHTAQYELLLVNDCSRDRSWAVIEGLTRAHCWIRGIDLMRNYGQHNALLCGIRAARYEVVVTMDDDLQNPPEEIPKLLEKLAEGYDVVYGNPLEKRHGSFRNMASLLTKLALRAAMGAQTARHVSAFRAFRTVVRQAFAMYGSHFVSIDVLLTWGTTRFSHVGVRQDQRTTGTSNYNFRKLLVHAMNMVTGFSTLPLQAASFLGFLATLLGMGVLAHVLYNYLRVGGAPAGFPFTASIIAIFSGIQLFALGMIGEYLARVYFRLLNRPSFVVRQQSGPIPDSAYSLSGNFNEVNHKDHEDTKVMQ